MSSEHYEKSVGLDHDFDIEQDLYKDEYILERVKEYSYAQALYAALCNNEWIPVDTMQLLRNEGILVSWRYAGGILSRMRGKGDYMDFYCSGSDEGMVSEGQITKEIRADLFKLGWVPKP